MSGPAGFHLIEYRMRSYHLYGFLMEHFRGDPIELQKLVGEKIRKKSEQKDRQQLWALAQKIKSLENIVNRSS